MRHGPVEQDRIIRRDGPAHAMERPPGIVVFAIAVCAFAVCFIDFAFGQARAGVTAAIVALLALGAGLSVLAMDRRRIRQQEREWAINRPAR